jgi:hypothetical protein
MKRLLKFAKLEGSKRRLLIKTVVAVGLVRLGLWLLPFRTLCTVLARFETPRGEPGLRRSAETLDNIMWALRIAAGLVPAATCLTQALTAKVLLRRNGYRPILRIGAVKSSTGKFLAHAWLEHEGAIVIGDLRDLSRYANFPPLDFGG